jgi:hypothetical protein
VIAASRATTTARGYDAGQTLCERPLEASIQRHGRVVIPATRRGGRQLDERERIAGRVGEQPIA